MSNEPEQPKPIIIRAFHAHPHILIGGGKVKLSWQVENAATLGISPLVGIAEDMIGDSTVDISEGTRFKLVARSDDESLEEVREIFVQVIPTPEQLRAEPQVIPGVRTIECPHPITGITGYLIAHEGIAPEVNGSPFKVVDPGLCPVCETEAEPYEPPVTNLTYMQNFTSVKTVLHHAKAHELGLDPMNPRELLKVEKPTDAEAHAEFLRKTGGYIAQCQNPNCSEKPSFFVPAHATKMK